MAHGRFVLLRAARLIAAPIVAKTGMQNIDRVEAARTVCTNWRSRSPPRGRMQDNECEFSATGQKQRSLCGGRCLEAEQPTRADRSIPPPTAPSPNTSGSFTRPAHHPPPAPAIDRAVG
jgi:hypothetical protein